MSWFFVFFRPINVYSCDLNLDLYFWNEDLYVKGVYISVFSLILLQLGGLAYSAKSSFYCFSLDRFRREAENISLFTFLICAALVILMFFNFGFKVFPSNRGEGAISVSMPGLEIFYHAIRAISFVLIIYSVVSFFILRNFKFVFYAVFSISVLMIFSKRNAIINPIIYAAFIYFFYHVRIRGFSFFRVLVKFFPLAAFVVFIAIFGKALKSQEGLNFEEPLDGYACHVVRLGMQEFDLFWPAVLDVSEDNVNAMDLPRAVLGGVLYGHNERIESEYLSITDKAMLKYNYQNYVYNKFGITPSLPQFYYYYFWWFGLGFLFLIAAAARSMDFLVARGFFEGRFWVVLFSIFFSKLLVSSFDFTLKYSLFEFFVFCFLFLFVFLGSRFFKIISLCR